MAIYPIMSHVPPPASLIDAQQAANIEAWTEQATEALASVSLAATTPRVPRGTSVTLSIPLDDPVHAIVAPHEGEIRRHTARQATTTNNAYGRKEPIRRDSLKRRESLLKGKEGSRQRRRWENDRLLNNPWAQPPSAADWEIRPTHRKRTVPYSLASLWDDEVAHNKKMEQRRKRFQTGRPEQADPASQVPKEVRARLKHARAAKGLLQDLEEDVRVFIQRWHEKQSERRKVGLEDVDSDEEEIVFVGRNGQMHDMPSPKRERNDNLQREKLVFDTPAEDRSAGFGRWLVHCIATYYGLQTWSITVPGEPARREAYVGINDEKFSIPDMTTTTTTLPRPLWGMV